MQKWQARQQPWQLRCSHIATNMPGEQGAKCALFPTVIMHQVPQAGNTHLAFLILTVTDQSYRTSTVPLCY